MRIIVSITDPSAIHDLRVRWGEPTAPPRIAPPRGPPPREQAGADDDPSASPLLQPTPAFEFDRRTAR